jgi:hypothetical protein
MPARMDPAPEIAATEALLLDQPKASAPFELGISRLAAEVREQFAVKPLRPPKERAPIAEAVDEQQVLDRASAAETVTLRPPPGPGLALAPVAPPAPAAPATFAGGTDNGTSIPPDTAGAAGPNHVFNPLNNNVWIFDRSGKAAATTVSLNRFWSGLGVQGDTFDPRAVFDPFSDRYVFACMADANLPTSRLLIAASTATDPLQWISHAIQVDDAAQGTVWFDFPSVGFTADKITVTVNLYTRGANGQFSGATIYVIDKQSLYNPPHQAPVQRFILKNKGGTHVPAVTYDSGTNDQYLVSRWGGNIQGQGYLLINKISGSVATNQAALTQVGFVGTATTWDSFPPADLGPQSAIPNRVSVGDDRILGACIRNGRLYCCHTVMLPAGNVTRSAVQWWEIDTATQSTVVGRIDDPSGAICYAAPSIAVNKQNDLLIGHAAFSAATHPSGAYTLRNSGGQPPAPFTFAPGQNSYFKTFSGATNRWGDYSHTQVDPTNDRDFWTAQEFAAAQADTWATMWAHITVPAAPTS